MEMFRDDRLVNKWKTTDTNQWNCPHVNKNYVLVEDPDGYLFVQNTDHPLPEKKGKYKWIHLQDIAELDVDWYVETRDYILCYCKPEGTD